MAPIMTDEVWRVSLGEAKQVAPSQTPVFGSYCPGELVQQCLRAPIMVMPPGLEECSTIATQRPCGAIAQLVDRTSLEASDDQDFKSLPFPAASELPSTGSLGHGHGCCKPCGFVHHENGCSAGVSCNFCHLCPPGAIERQRQKKRQLVRATRRDPNGHSNTGSLIRSASPTDGSATSPEHYAASECSTVDTQGAEAEASPLMVAKSTVKDSVDMPSTGLASHSHMQPNHACVAVAECLFRRGCALGSIAPGASDSHKLFGPMYAHVSATNSAAASAKTAAARVIALQKRGGA